MIAQLTQRIEAWLRIDPNGPTSEVMRARAVYLIGGAFILTQVINMISMRYSYGGFTLDHVISVVACLLVFATINMLRLHKTFWIYALIFSTLIIAGTFASALPDKTGINSALLPFFVLGIITNGFVAGLRSTVVFSVFALASVWFLFWISSNYAHTPLFDVEKFADRNFQRAVQTSLAIVMIALVAGVFSHHMHAAFAQLETDIETAEAADRDKTLFLTTMSHELTTPLNGIISLSDVLSEDHLTPDQREMVGLINRSGADLQGIIRNVLTYSQIEQDRIAIDAAPFDLAAVIARTIRPHMRIAFAKGVQFDVQLANNVPPVLLGDAARLAQIVDALLSNAVKFTERGSIQLSVMCRTVDAAARSDVSPNAPDALPLASLVIAVRDTGAGIPDDQLLRIYDRFRQGDGSITRKHGGTGLGLTVAQGLSQIMGAQLAAQSRVATTPGDTGAGSIFTLALTLPIGDPEAKSAISAEPLPSLQAA